jgi:uncharacterized protein (DUF2141 family)/methionine-rich copper-binding protein CopC
MKQSLQLLLLLFLILACANEGALTGGKADDVAPTILSSNPVQDTTNIGEMRTFSLTFSESVDRNSVEENSRLFPLSDKRLAFEWDAWDKVEITLPDSLEEEKSYQFILARSHKDLHGVQAENEFRIAFTVSGNLDSEKLTGRVKYKGAARKNLRLALFAGDSIVENATYITDVSKENTFSFTHLKAGTYLPVFFTDENNNFKIDIQTEMLAIPQQSFTTSMPELKPEFLSFINIDTIPPSIEAIDTISKDIFQLKTNEAIDLKRSKLFFVDSNLANVEVRNIFKLKKNLYQIVADVSVLKSPFRFNYSTLFDLAGNRAKTFTAFTELHSAVAVDTAEFTIKTISLRDSIALEENLKSIRLTYTNSFLLKDENTIRATLNDVRTKEDIPIKLKQMDAKTVELVLDGDLGKRDEYRLSINHKSFLNLAQSKMKDTTVTRYFSTNIENRYGEIRLRVLNDSKFVWLVFYDVESAKEYSMRKIPTNVNVLLDKLTANRYHLEIFVDLNNNERHDKGQLFPYLKSEPYYIHSDTIPVRANWERVIGDIRL